MVDAFATIDPITLLAKQFCHGEPVAMGLSRMLMPAGFQPGRVVTKGRMPPGGATSGELDAEWIATRPCLAIIST
jgi:hypothetical protein